MKSRFLIASLTLPILIPPVVFVVCGVWKGMPVAEISEAFIQQYTARRQNLLVCGLIGLFPIGLLHGCLWFHRWKKGNPYVQQAMASGGLSGILLVLIWVNFEFWPAFLPERVYPGFPHGLEFIIGPGLFSPIAMFFGMTIGWLFARGATSMHA